MREFINYAHRGASQYYPENTLISFYAGWQMGANGIETDVQSTKDGVPVLFHDDTMKRLAGREERICDLTYEELCEIDVGRHKGENFSGERVPTLEEFIHHFSGKGLHLALELKQAGIERQVLDYDPAPMAERSSDRHLLYLGGASGCEKDRADDPYGLSDRTAGC